VTVRPIKRSAHSEKRNSVARMVLSTITYGCSRKSPNIIATPTGEMANPTQIDGYPLTIYRIVTCLLCVALWAPQARCLEEHSQPAARTQNTSSKQMTDRKVQDQVTFEWRRSLPIDQRDTAIGIIGGTEARALAGMDGRLYAGIGYWSDSQEANPELPGGQVLALDSPTSKWRVDLNLDERIKTGPAAGKRRYFAIAVLRSGTFTTDGNGHHLAHPVHALLAGTWDRLGQLEVFSKVEGSGSWSMCNLSPEDQSRHAEIRSFYVYRDKVTNTDHVFAGTRVNGASLPTRIYSGEFDPSDRTIHWNKTAEGWGDQSLAPNRTTHSSGRIMGFAECNGKLYTSIYNMIFERQDGAKPSWKLVYTYKPMRPFGERSSGLRGLHTVPDPEGKGQALLVTTETRPCLLLRINTLTFGAVEELNISAFLRKEWSTPVRYAIAGYNDMLSYSPNGESHSQTLIGLHASTPELPGTFKTFNPTGAILVRNDDASFRLGEIEDRSLNYKPILQAVRTVVNSPFQSDPPGTIYAGGFDAGGVPVHNTAWIYRGAPH